MSEPTGWQRSRLGDVATILMGQAPSSHQVREGGNGKPFVQGSAEFGDKFPKARLTCIRPPKSCLPGDVLISVRAPVGDINIADQEYAIGRGLAAVRFFSIDPAFGSQLLRPAAKLLHRHAQGSTFDAINSTELAVLAVKFPQDRWEQWRIAEILDTLDQQISRSERMVSKSQVFREAMLVDLLTRDNSRSEPMEALLAAGPDAMRSGPFGSELLASEFRSSGIPLLGIDNVERGKFISHYARFVDFAKFRELQRYRVRPRDVMVTIMGTVGRSCLVPDDIGLALSSKHVWTITLDQSKYRAWLASLQINYAPWARDHFRRDSQGGIMSAIRSETLRTLRLPVLPLEAQVTIENVLRAQTELIARERDTLHKLRLVKRGLMEDLLTGKVRVRRLGELTG